MTPHIYHRLTILLLKLENDIARCYASAGRKVYLKAFGQYKVDHISHMRRINTHAKCNSSNNDLQDSQNFQHRTLQSNSSWYSEAYIICRHMTSVINLISNMNGLFTCQRYLRSEECTNCFTITGAPGLCSWKHVAFHNMDIYLAAQKMLSKRHANNGLNGKHKINTNSIRKTGAVWSLGTPWKTAMFIRQFWALFSNNTMTLSLSMLSCFRHSVIQATSACLPRSFVVLDLGLIILKLFWWLCQKPNTPIQQAWPGAAQYFYTVLLFCQKNKSGYHHALSNWS